MALRTLEELQTSYDALTGRIVAIDLDISRETDSERRKTLTDRRTDMAIEREKIAADIAILHPGYPLTVVANAPLLEHRVTKLETDLRLLWSMLRPGPRQLVSRLVFYGLLLGLWSMWMVKEVRDWMIMHPAQAIVITIAVFVAALIIRWLPEEKDYDQR